MPSGLSSERAAAFSPLTNSRSTRCSSLTTRMRLTGFAIACPYNRAHARRASGGVSSCREQHSMAEPSASLTRGSCCGARAARGRIAERIRLAERQRGVDTAALLERLDRLREPALVTIAGVAMQDTFRHDAVDHAL